MLTSLSFGGSTHFIYSGIDSFIKYLGNLSLCAYFSPMQKWYTVYVLKCKDGNFYTGCTGGLEGRLLRHQKGYVTATKYRRPLVLVLKVQFPTKFQAFDFEKYLKSGSGKAFLFKRLVRRQP